MLSVLNRAYFCVEIVIALRLKQGEQRTIDHVTLLQILLQAFLRSLGQEVESCCASLIYYLLSRFSYKNNIRELRSKIRR